MNLQQLKDACSANNIPIVRKQTLNELLKLISDYQLAEILEIGSAYGYSAVCLSENQFVKKIISLEKNEQNYNFIKNNINNQKINFLLVDAFNYQPDQQFDLIFLDGPKSHQIDLFKHYEKFLKPNGYFFIDNIFLKKFDHYLNLNRNQKSLIKKVNQFRQWLESLPNWNVEIFDVEDGYAICKRK